MHAVYQMTPRMSTDESRMLDRAHLTMLVAVLPEGGVTQLYSGEGTLNFQEDFPRPVVAGVALPGLPQVYAVPSVLLESTDSGVIDMGTATPAIMEISK